MKAVCYIFFYKFIEVIQTNTYISGSDAGSLAIFLFFYKFVEVNDSPAAGYEPPDGGWGWVVCLASFWTNGTLFGILNCFGILYKKMLVDFSDGSKEMAFKTCKYCQHVYKI